MAETILTQSEIAKLLGRDLSSREKNNLETYLDIAQAQLEELLCISLSEEKNTEREFLSRANYRTVFTDIFSSVSKVKVNGAEFNSDDYTAKQWNKSNADWYNSIVFNRRLSDNYEIEVTADWGFSKLPSDLKLMLAQMFANTSKRYETAPVKSKKVEDFSITLDNSVDNMQKFLADNANLVKKYSLCNIDNVQIGETYADRIRSVSTDGLYLP